MAKKPKKKNEFKSYRKDSNKKIAEVRDNTFVFSSPLTVSELADKINVPTTEVITYFFKQGKFFNANSMLTEEMIAEVCLNYDLDFKKEEVLDKTDFSQLLSNENCDPSSLTERCPVVTIMGHVDHGKTTLIDTIRSSHLASKEAGLITQSIGAYQKSINNKKITFIDTPGHAAFKAMRARGASITDIIVLVVAADDGIMPQTKEAIHLAKVSNIPLIVAINKIDKETANIERVYSELAANNVICEEWGGDTMVRKISAKKNIGIDELLEAILLLAEMMELKANPSINAIGTVIEAKLDKAEGPKATFLVQNGTLSSGDNIVVGDTYSKIRKMTNEHNNVVKSAFAGTPVVVTGLSVVPSAGTHFIAYASDKEAKDAANIIKQKNMLSSSQSDEDNFNMNNIDMESSNIFLIIKADTSGSAEVVKDYLSELHLEGVKLNIIRAAPGDVNENDVLLAVNTLATIISFKTKVNTTAMSLAKEKDVTIKTYDIIYKIVDDIKEMMVAELKPVYKEVIYGHCRVLQLFKFSKVGQIAGCVVIDGTIKRDTRIRVIRKNKVILEDHLSSLRIVKNDVKEVKEGFECGLTLSKFQELTEDDILESYGSEIDTDATKRFI